MTKAYEIIAASCGCVFRDLNVRCQKTRCLTCEHYEFTQFPQRTSPAPAGPPVTPTGA